MLVMLLGGHCYGFLRGHNRKPETSSIPRLGSMDPRVNLGGEKKHGDYYMTRLVEATDFKTTVFKVKMERERIVISDPIAIHAMYDVKNIEKTLSGGSTEFNLLSTGGYHPSFLDNGWSFSL